MPLSTNVQAVGGATSAAAPATVSPAWAAAGAGNALVVFVGGALSGAPTISTPAGWTLVISSIQGTVVAVFAYVLPGASNAGGSTGVTFNLTNFNGAAWMMYELNNTVANTPYDGSNVKSITSAGSTAVNLPVLARTNNAVRELGAIASVSTSGAFTNGGVGGQASWIADVAAQTSTNGATNVILTVQSLQQGAAPQLAKFGGTLAVSAAWAALELLMLSTSSGAYGYGPWGAQPDITQGYAVVGNQ